MALDGGCVGAAARLDDVAVEGALHEELLVPQLGRLGVERVDELGADDLALLLRVGDAGELRQELLLRAHVHERHVEVMAEGLLHLLALVHAQHAVVDEHAGEAVADGPVHQQRRHGAVHTTRQAADCALVTHLVLDALHLVIDDIGRGPRGREVTRVEQERLQQVGAEGRVDHLGVELHPESPAGAVLHRRDGCARRLGRHREAVRSGGHRVAVAHPARLGGKVAEKALARMHADVRAAELAGAVVCDHAAKGLGH